MTTHALLSAMGRDRVGVADDLARALRDRSIAIEESRMTSLRGQFALIVQVCGEEGKVAILGRDLTTLASELGFGLQLKRIESSRKPARERRRVIETFSRGASGIHAVTGVLKRYDVSIEHLETDSSASSWTSAIEFHMKAHISIPASCPVTRLNEDLLELEREHNMDIVIQPVSSEMTEGTASREPSPESTPGR